MGKVLRMHRATYETLHALAIARWREAVECRLAGDEDGYLSRMADVRALDERAAEARVREQRRDAQHRAIALALEGILELAEQRGPRGVA